MDFCILGPLEARDQGRAVRVGGRAQRALLAVLLLHANELLTIDRLIEELWGENPPAKPSQNLRVCISRLRRAFADADGGAAADMIVTHEHGYELRLEPECLDARRFERLAAEGSTQLAEGQAELAASTLESALALWRGPALADLSYEPFAQREIARLEGQRVAAHEHLLDARLALGAHADVIGQLEALVAEHPYRERLRWQLMLALYRSDRQADALQAYQDARRTLVEELGIEPGERLRELERAILAQDPALNLVVEDRPAVEAPIESPRGELVGRVDEVAELMSGLDDAFAARGRLFLLAGEPGIGKSRLAEEVIVAARSRGARVLVGRCWEAGGAPAYWPWVQALRGYVRETDADSLESQLEDGAGALAQLLPELRGPLGDPAPAPSPDPEGARFELFESVATFVGHAALARPLVIVLDDLHAADEPSLLLLRFVARELGRSRVLIVGAYRDVDPTLAYPLAATLAELAREPVTTRIALAGLGEPDVARFIDRVAPGASGSDLAPAVHAETEGNPLFVGEIVRLLGAERRLGTQPSGSLAIPASVREVIGRRMRHLSDECNSLLALASVLGREFDLRALAEVSGGDAGQILETLDEGLEARVVAEVPDGIGHMRFAHALIRDAAYQRVPRSRRLELHRRVGEALETLYAADLDPHLAELAHHFFEAAAMGDGEKAVAYAERAGARAVKQLAYEEAVRLYEMSLRALGPESAAAARRRCELLLALADAQSRAGSAEAKGTSLRAAELARSAALPDMLARAAAGYGGRFLWTHERADERVSPLFEDALAALGEDDSPFRVHLLSRLAAALRHGPSRERRERLSGEAVEIARRLGDPATLAYALVAAEAAVHAPQTARRRLAEAAEIVSLASQAGDRERVFDGHEHGFWAAWELGDAERRAADLASMSLVVDELRQPAQAWILMVAEASLALSQGSFAEATELIDRAATSGERILSWEATAASKLQRFLLHLERGQLASFEPEVRDHAADFPSPLVHEAVLSHLYARLGRTGHARTHLRELMRRDLANWHVDEEWLASICLLAETSALVGDVESTPPLYDLLLPFAAHNAVAVPELPLDSASRPLGILASLLGRFDDAATHFEDALEMNERMGARPGLAHTQTAYAQMLLRRDAAGDRARAGELLASARAIHAELGMPVPSS